MLLTDSPINSTQVENTTRIDSHHDLELSRIVPPSAEHNVQPRAELPTSPNVVPEQPDYPAREQSHVGVDTATSLVPEDMVLTGLACVSVASESSDLFRCHCGRECTR